MKHFEKSDGQPETDFLIESYLENTLTEQDAEILLDRLEASEELRRQLFERVESDLFLRATFGTGNDVSSMIRESGNLYFMNPAPSHSRRYRWPRIRTVLIGCIVILMFGVVYHAFKTDRLESSWARRESPREKQVVAKILKTVDAVWENPEEAFKSGEEIGPNKLHLRSGWVQIEFADGVVAILEGPTEFVFRDENRGFCHLGKVWFRVPSRATGFTVITPFTEVVDHGTEFAIHVTEKETEVHVVSGKVEMVAASLILETGGTAALDYRKTLHRRPLEPAKYLFGDAFEQREAEFLSRKKAKSLEIRQDIQADPDLLYRFGPDDTTHGGRIDEGSRPDRQAFYFTGKRDRIEMSVETTRESMTLVARVRIDRMGKDSNTLFLCDDFYTAGGAFLWQIDPQGRGQFHQRLDDRTAIFDSRRLFDEKDLKTWTFLALVVNAEDETIAYYKDGRLVDRMPWSPVTPLRIRSACIGNESPSGRKKLTERFLKGGVEDFLIFSRPLDENEILNLHENL